MLLQTKTSHVLRGDWHLISNCPRSLALLAEGADIIIMSKDAQGFQIARKIRLAAEANWASVSPNGDLIGVVTRDRGVILDPSGNLLCDFSYPAHNRRLGGCAFSSDGTLFWADTPGGFVVYSLVERKIVSHYCFPELKGAVDDYVVYPVPHPTQALFGLLVLAGQDFQGLFWAKQEGTGFVVTKESSDNIANIAFNDMGTEYLADAFDVIYRKSFPQGHLLGQMNNIDCFPERDDEFYGLTNYYSPTSAMFRSNNGQLFTFDAISMDLKEQVTIECEALQKNFGSSWVREAPCAVTGDLLTTTASETMTVVNHFVVGN